MLCKGHQGPARGLAEPSGPRLADIPVQSPRLCLLHDYLLQSAPIFSYSPSYVAFSIYSPHRPRVLPPETITSIS
jgi:hypothetical protein